MTIMAGGKPRKPRTLTNNNIDDLKKSLENGLYTHSSPPKVAGGTGGNKIREMVRNQDIVGLEEILLSGNGQALINQPSTDKSVRNFLKTVPAYMSKIELVHDAAERGNLRDLKALLDRRKLAKSRDSKGVGLLHKAVLHGHQDIVDYLIQQYPESIEVRDNDGRTALHYSAISKYPEDMYNFMSDKLMDVEFRDDKGKTAAYYMQRPSELSLSRSEVIRSGLSPTRKKRSPLSKKNSPTRKMKSPPKRDGLNVTGANIRIWIHDKDLPKLEQIVWDGQGHRLLNETSNHSKVRQFLQLVPRMMTKIKEVHQSAISGDLDTMQAKADQPEFLLAKDHNGLNPLHKAAGLGHMDICEWIVQKNQNALFGIDKNGRSPLFYSTNPTDGGVIYDLFIKCGADDLLQDQYKKTADYYRGRPGDIDISIVYDAPSAPRTGGSFLDFPSSKFPSRSNSGGKQRSLDANPPKTETKLTKKYKPKTEFFNNLYNRGRKDMVGKRKYVDMSRVTDREIEKMLQDGDVTNLEYVVLSGRGDSLGGKTSWHDKARKFIKDIPKMNTSIKDLITYASDGDFTAVQEKTRKNPKLSMARDSTGAIALHYAARSGNIDTVKHLMDCYQDGIYVEDQDRRVPVHWAAISREPGAYLAYDLLEKKGSYVHACDVNGKSANDYFKEIAADQNTENNPDDTLDVSNDNGIVNDALDADNLVEESEIILADTEPNLNTNLRPQSISPVGSPSKGGRKSRNRLKSKSPSRRNLSVSPARNKSNSPSRNNSKSPARNKSKSPSKNISKSPSRMNSKSPPINNIKSPAKNIEKPKPKTVTKSILQKDASKRKTKKKLDEIQQAINDAENEDYKGISQIILRGDGNRLVGRKSSNDEVQRFLKDLPESLESIGHIQCSVEDGDLREAMNLIDRKEKAYVRDANGSNLLHLATINGHSEMARYLVQNFSDLLHQKDKAGRTPMHYAATVRDGGHITKILKMANGDPFIEDDAGHTAEDYENDIELLTQKQLVEELMIGRETKDKEDAILAQATEITSDDEGSQEQSIQEPEKESENLTDEKEEEETIQSESNPEEEIEKAIQNAEKENFDGLAEIIRRGDGNLLLNKTSKDKTVTEYLMKIPDILASIDEAYIAVENGNTKKVSELIDRKQKALVRTTKQASFLHVAIINGHSDTVRYLTKTYPSLLITEDTKGRTPLHYAAVVRDGGHIYKILKRSEADAAIKDKAGYSSDDYLHDPQLLTQWDIMKELKMEPKKDDRPITKDSVASYYGSEEEGMEKADGSTIQSIEDAFKILQNSDSKSLMNKYLTKDVFDNIKHRKTELGATLLDAINSGVQNLDSGIGLYAPDAESYVLFKELFDPVIEEYHGVSREDDHPETEFGDVELFGDLNDFGDFVVSTRIRCARSLEGYPFNPKMTVENYTELEQDIEGALDMFDGDLAGYYTPLGDLTEEEAQRLTDEHLMFKQGDRFLEAAGASHFWPQGRGIYLNHDDTLVVWINEEDHMRIISMQKGGDVRQVYDKFIRAVEILEDRLPFSHSQKHGYLTFCPTNLGTAIRASVHIKLPQLGKNKEKLENIAEQFHLQVRGTRGEHSEAEDSVFDISNKRRLGLTEIDTIQDMYEGVEEIIRVEIELGGGSGN